MSQQPYSVLVIDDEPMIRRLLEKELATVERQILSAPDAGEAMAMVRANWFDVILMDLRLPDKNGLDLLVEVKEQASTSEIIMITGHGDVDSAVMAMKLGAYDFIPKPFNLDQLDMLVEKAHQRAVLARENSMLRHSTGR